MNEIIIKLNQISDLVISNNKLGRLVFFGIIARTDVESKWDILISASGLKENNSESDLTYIIDLLKKEFSDNLSFLSQIVLLTPKEDFIKDLARALIKIDKKIGEVSDLKLIENYTLQRLYVIYSDFSNLDLTVEEKNIQDNKDVKNFG